MEAIVCLDIGTEINLISILIYQSLVIKIYPLLAILKQMLLRLNLKPDFPAASSKYPLHLSLTWVSHLLVHYDPTFSDYECHLSFRDLINHLKHGPLTLSYPDFHSSVPELLDVELNSELFIPFCAHIPRSLL